MQNLGEAVGFFERESNRSAPEPVPIEGPWHLVASKRVLAEGVLAIFLPESITLLRSTADGVAMVRALCLAVLCLLFLGVALAFMPGSRALTDDVPALPPAASVAAVSDVGASSFVVNTSSKADKLPIAPSVDALEKVPVETIRITPVEAEIEPQPRSAPKKSEVVGWHWHAGSNIKRRTRP